MKDHNKKIFLKGILEYSSNLKLATFKDTVESEIRNATEIDSSYEELIYKLLQKECDYKQEQLRKNRIRTAKEFIIPMVTMKHLPARETRKA